MTLSYYDVLDVDPRASTDEVRAAWRAAVADLDPTDRRFRAYNNAAEVLLDPDRRATHDAELAVAAESVGEEDTADEEAPSPEAPADASSSVGTRAADETAEETAGSSVSAGGPVTAGGTATAVTAPAREDTRESFPADGEAAEGEQGSAGESAARTRRGPGAPVWLLAVLTVATAAVAAVAVWLVVAVPSEDEVADAAEQARATAERAIEPVLSYDAANLEASRSNAAQHLTDDFREEYAQIFDGIVETNAPDLGTTVEAGFVASGTARTNSEDPGRVQVLLFVDQSVTNKQQDEPVINRNQVTVTMQRTDGEWLIDGLRTSPLPE